MEINNNNAANLFYYVTLQQTGMDELSQTALSSAIDSYQGGDYDKAIKEFRRSIALSPYNDKAADTYDYMAGAYLKLNDARNAEKAYQSALRMDPQREDIQLNLGNLYYAQGKYADAEKSYRSAVKLYPSAETLYSLAHCCLGVGKLADAEAYFTKVISLEPKSGNGQYGLGMTYAKQGEYKKAISSFEEALELKPGFDDARVEMGYALADSGRIEEAEKQIEILEENESDQSSLLYAYVYKVKTPQFVSAYQGNFNWNLSIRTPISALDNYLMNADETRYFTVQFSFNKDMDAKSVQNPLNWSITKADGYGPQGYNFGLKQSANDTDISRIPKNILYDPSTRTAAVTFAIKQNEFADGIMDPSHIQFTFSGTDVFGTSMDAGADSFSRFNGFV
jgi:tetratricopeptide (TPR) repeat protein